MVLHLFEGAITGCAFDSGHAVVLGTWARSPLGKVIDVMWRHPGGHRVLLAPRQDVADYISSLYAFDEVRVVPISGGIRGADVVVDAEPLELRARVAPPDWRSWLFALRPRVARRSRRWIELEDRLARPFVGRLLGGGDGVRAAGVAPGGQREWYGADDWRALSAARLRIDGVDQGAMRPLPTPFGVGLSGFPTAPASVRLGTLVESG